VAGSCGHDNEPSVSLIFISMIYVTTSPVSLIMESQMEDNYKQLIKNDVKVSSRNLVTDIIVVCYCSTAPTLIRT
jgi:hypothetical protein